MTKTWRAPLEDYLCAGITALEAKQLLAKHDCLAFPALRSGLFPAANFANLDENTNGMANAWLRDSALIGLLLLYDGQRAVAARTVKGILAALDKVRPELEQAIAAGKAPDDPSRPPICFVGQRSEPRREWPNAQNDAFGYVLQFVGRAAEWGAVALSEGDIALLDLLPAYLQAISYWQDQDFGHWEDFRRCNASSVGAVLGGLEAAQPFLHDEALIDDLITKGRRALNAILPNASVVPVKREYDSALLFMVEPMRVVSEDMAHQIVTDIETHLVGEYGTRRYNRDSYWAPDFRYHLKHSDMSNLALREKLIKKPGTEAQWTLFDPMLSAYYAHRFAATNDPASKDKASHYLVRSLRQVITHTHELSGQEVWRIPEAFFLENDEWVPNDHLGLLWSQANLLYALDVYNEVFGEQPIPQAEPSAEPALV